MDSREFETVVDEVIHRLPEWVREAFDNIEILVADEPDAGMTRQHHYVLGLYKGIPLTERGVSYAGALPDVIYIYRLPHLALGLPPDQLRQEIARTVMHEVAHYFGIDDHHLEEIGWG
jgi:predicted Zn-dependent protease with MMP-like domain